MSQLLNDPVGTEYKGAPERFASGGYYRGNNGRYYVWKNKAGGPVWVVQDEPPVGLGTVEDVGKTESFEIPSNAPSSPTGKNSLNNVIVPEAPAPAPIALKFPSDMDVKSDTDYVMFDFYNYRPPFKGQFERDEETRERKEVYNETLNQYNNSRYTEEYEPDPRMPQIRLYMPDDVQDAFKADWQGKAFGAGTVSKISAAAADGLDKKMKKAFESLASDIRNMPINTASAAITKLASGIAGDSITADDIFGGISGVVRNPNTELLFEKMNLRTFDLTFKMAPYNQDDAKYIDKIITTFKRAMLPTYEIGDASVFGTKAMDSGSIQARFIKVPRVCQVTYMTGSRPHSFLPHYKKTAITDFKVNYTPENNYATLNDTFPVAVEIKISFMETKLIFADDIDPNTELNLNNTRPKGAYGGASDIRLKENIVKVGNSPSGINIYEWNYKSAPNSRYRGVMAHEILEEHPEAVALEPDGYMSVFYGKIDVNMERVK